MPVCMNVCVCVCVRVYARMLALACVHACVCALACVHKCVCALVCACIHVCVHLCVCTCVCLHLHMCASIHHMFALSYTCMSVSFLLYCSNSSYLCMHVLLLIDDNRVELLSPTSVLFSSHVHVHGVHVYVCTPSTPINLYCGSHSHSGLFAIHPLTPSHVLPSRWRQESGPRYSGRTGAGKRGSCGGHLCAEDHNWVNCREGWKVPMYMYIHAYLFSCMCTLKLAMVVVDQ